MNRRDVVLGTLAACAGAVSAQPAPYPRRPVTWVVPWPAGGGADFVARVLSEQLARRLGQPFVVDNRPGGGGIIGAQFVARAPADGHTLFQGDNGPLVFNSALYRKLPYDPVRDFVPLTLICRYPLVLAANPNVPAANAREFFELARKSPGRLNYASVGTGSAFHLAMELLKQQTGTFIVHVPYKGAGPAIQDLISGQVEASVLSTAAALPLIKAGRLKALGSMTASRQATLPDVPTMAELGIRGAEVYAWQGMLAPAGTPASVTTRLTAELGAVLGSAETRQKFAEHGVEPIPGSAEEMVAHVQKEAALWHPLIRQRGITLE